MPALPLSGLARKCETMTAPEESIADKDVPAPSRRRWLRWAVGVALALALGLGWAWLARKDIADDYLAGQLEQMELPAGYEVGAIGPTEQVLRKVVIGDPARPDFTAEEVRLRINYTFGIPSIGQVTLVRPRLYGTLKDGKPSFGSLDKLLFTGSTEPFRLPEIDIAIRDGRGLLESDWGPVGIRIDGQGPLRNGFAGTLAIAAPNLAFGDCRASGVSAFGALSVKGQRPAFDGPLRLARLDCVQQGITLADAAVAAKASANGALDAFDADLSLKTGALRLAGGEATSGAGSVRAGWKNGALTARYDLTLARAGMGGLGAGRIGTEGLLRSADGLARIEAEGTLSGDDLLTGPGLDQTLAGAERSSAGTFAAPMLAQLRVALKREARGSTLAGSYTLRQTGGVTSLVMPQARLTGASGAALLSLSSLHYTSGERLGPSLSGNFVTSGAGLPRLTGRVEQRRRGAVLMRLAMAEYAAGGSRLAVPELMVSQTGSGALGFAGQVRLTGALPGGSAQGLVLPVEGNWSAAQGLALWRRCTALRFARLELAYLTLERQGLTLCPGSDGAIVRAGPGGTRIAAGMAGLALSGAYAGTPIRVKGASLGMAWPGTLVAKDLDVLLGAGAEPHRFTLASLDARLDSRIEGRFAGLGASLAGVPLDVGKAEGRWSYAGNALRLSEASLTLTDRQQPGRFNPLVARGASLLLTGGVIDAEALLREPESDREVTRALIRHSLNDGRGHADLLVDGIRFDIEGLQPVMISELVRGVIADAQGTVTGRGRIDWTPDAVTSTGDFATDSFDFAAEFGPAKGVSGRVHFTDLLGLVTAPDQRLRIASINPGIEVNDGELSFELRPDGLLVVNGAKWPFLDGTLVLEPSRMVLGAAETRRFTLTIDGLDAARFLQRMELGNIAATGVFDGKMPLVFDENGGRIEGGALVSRPPGGNVSYVGALTYKDLSPMANFAFDALKSIDYKTMRIDLDGALAGEIVTRVAFEGLGQGATARRNFITRQVAKLPIRFNVNIKAPFYKFVTSIRSIYDPNYLPDPRVIGLVGPDGKRLVPPGTPSDPRVQPPVSETKP